MTICTVSAIEAQQRIDKARDIHQRMFTRGIEGAEALMWFSDYALNAKRDELPGAQVFSLKADMLHKGSTRHTITASYIERAAATYADKILADAIALARWDVGRGDELARPKPPVRS